MAGKVVDFSHHQGSVDFAAAKADGLELAIIRVQYGSTTMDRRYKEYVDGCKANGIPFGHYAYARFLDVADARKEARDFLARIDKDAKFLVVDVEELTTTKDQVVAATQAFIDVCKAAGYKTGLYTGHHFYKPYNMDQVKADFLWLPRYGTNNGQPTTKPDWPCDIWQYTEKGKIAGVAGYVDLNILNKPLEFFVGSQPKPVEPAKTQPKPQPAPKSDPNAGFLHVVKSGETLSAIAAKYKTTVKHLAALNDIADINRIYPGQRLKLQGKVAAAPSKPSKPKKPAAQYHTVKNGDVLSKVAAKYGQTINVLKRLNPQIKNIDLIYPGQKIRVK